MQGQLQEFEHQADSIEQLLAIGTALSGSKDLGEVLNLILSKSREITFSDAGSLYLIDKSEEIPFLIFKVAQNDSLPSSSFEEFALPMTAKSLAGYVALTGESLNLPDAYELPQGVPYQLDRRFDRDFSYRTRSVLVLPMQNHEGENIGVLQLINRKIRPDEVVTPENALEVTLPYSESEERIVRSLASQAAISIERNQMQESFLVTELQQRYGLATSSIYSRLEALNIKPHRRRDRAYITDVHLRQLDILHAHIQQGGTAAEFVGEAKQTEQVPDSPGGRQTEVPDERATLAALLEAMQARLSPTPAPLANLEALERAYKNRWLLATTELAPLLGVNPRSLGKKSTFSRSGFVFTKAGRSGNQTAWKVGKPEE